MKPARLIHIALLLSILGSCAARRYEVFDFLGREHAARIGRIMNEDDYSSRFVIMHDFLKQLLSSDAANDLRSFVHQYTVLDPEDPFNSY